MNSLTKSCFVKIGVLALSVSSASPAIAAESARTPSWFEPVTSCLNNLDQFPSFTPVVVTNDGMVMVRPDRIVPGANGSRSGLWMIRSNEAFFIETNHVNDRLNLLSRGYGGGLGGYGLYSMPGQGDEGDEVDEGAHTVEVGARRSSPARRVRSRAGSVRRVFSGQNANEGYTTVDPDRVPIAFATELPGSAELTSFMVYREGGEGSYRPIQINYGSSVNRYADRTVAVRSSRVISPDLKDALLGSLHDKIESLNPAVTPESQWNLHAGYAGSTEPNYTLREQDSFKRRRAITPVRDPMPGLYSESGTTRQAMQARRAQLAQTLESCRESLRNVAGADSLRELMERTEGLVSLPRPGVNAPTGRIVPAAARR